MAEPGSELYAIGTQVSDRLGRHANSDSHWFDSEVRYWSEPDGVRLTTYELVDLGRKTVDWIVGGNLAIPEAVFTEMETILSDGFGTDRGSTERGFCISLLEGLESELGDLKKKSNDKYRDTDRTLRHLMGDETKLVWAGIHRS